MSKAERRLSVASFLTALVMFIAVLFVHVCTGCGTINLSDPVEDTHQAHEGTVISLGPVAISGAQWSVGGESVQWMPVAWDCFDQPADHEGFKWRIDHFADAGVNLIVTYAGPGLGKPFNGGNAHHPYSDVKNLVRIPEYWTEVIRRLEYANAKGISVLCSYSFVDQGMLNSAKVDQHALNREIVAWATNLDGYSVILSPVSEADEGGSSGIARTLDLIGMVRGVTDTPVGFHSTGDNGRQAQHVDFISVQDSGSLNYSNLKKLTETGKPVMVVENQRSGDDAKVMEKFRKCKEINVAYAFTGRSRGFSPWLFEEVRKESGANNDGP